MNRHEGIWERTFALGLLAAVWVAFHFKVLFLGHTFLWEDASRFFHPLWRWSASIWGGGVIPLWDPAAGFGTPFFADPQTCCWYWPLRVLYLFLDPTTAFNWAILLHHAFLVMGAWAYGRSKGLDPFPAVVGALVLGFSFNAIASFWAPPMLFAFSWVPWIFLIGSRIRQGRPMGGTLFAAALSFQLSAGYPLFSYLTWLVLLLDFFLMGPFSEGPKERLRSLAYGAGAVIFALAYNACWLIPFREYIPLSNLGAREKLTSSLGLGDLTTFLDPFSHGHPVFSHPDSPFSVTVFFLGLPFLVFGVVRCLKGLRDGHWVFFLGLVVVLSLGETAWVGGWFKTWLLGYSMVVRSGYWIPFLIWVFILGWAQKGNAPWEPEDKKWVWTAMSLVYGGAVFYGVPWDLLSLWVSLLLLVLSTFVSGKVWVRQGLFFGAVLFSLWPMARGIHYTQERSYYDQPPRLAAPIGPDQRIYDPPDFEESYQKVAGKDIPEIFSKIKESLVSNGPQGWGLSEIGYSNAIFPAGFLPWYFAPLEVREPQLLLDYLSVDWVLGGLPNLKGFQEVAGEPVPLFRTIHPTGSWRSCSKGVLENDWKSDLAQMAGGRAGFPGTSFVPEAGLCGLYHPRDVHVSGGGPNEKDISAFGKGQALLVSSDLAYPGWKAVVGPESRPLVMVNHGFQGLLLKDGEQEAKLVFRPTSFRLGLFVSLLSLALLGILMILGVKTIARI